MFQIGLFDSLSVFTFDEFIDEPNVTRSKAKQRKEDEVKSSPTPFHLNLP